MRRFEVVRTDAGWHGRFVAANGKMLWTTEVYQGSRRAVRAIELVTAMSVYRVLDDMFITHGRRAIEVRRVDERAGRRSSAREGDVA